MLFHFSHDFAHTDKIVFYWKTHVFQQGIFKCSCCSGRYTLSLWTISDISEIYDISVWTKYEVISVFCAILAWTVPSSENEIDSLKTLARTDCSVNPLFSFNCTQFHEGHPAFHLLFVLFWVSRLFFVLFLKFLSCCCINWVTNNHPLITELISVET